MEQTSILDLKVRQQVYETTMQRGYPPSTGDLASSLDIAVEEIRAADTYANVHTNDGLDPPNSGPGDYRLGEIRGQIQ